MSTVLYSGTNCEHDGCREEPQSRAGAPLPRSRPVRDPVAAGQRQSLAGSVRKSIRTGAGDDGRAGGLQTRAAIAPRLCRVGHMRGRAGPSPQPGATLFFETADGRR